MRLILNARFTQFVCFRYLIEWSQKNETIIPEDIECANMDVVAFEDLYIRFGCPYIFLHLGDCEHIVIFKDIK